MYLNHCVGDAVVHLHCGKDHAPNLLEAVLILGVTVMLKMVLVELDLEVAGASKLDVALVTTVMYLRKMALFVEVI